MKNNAVLIPSFSRSNRIQKCLDYLLENSKISDIYIGLDQRDTEIDLYRKLIHQSKGKENIHLVISETNNLVENLNSMAKILCDKYDFLSFLGDDQIVKTKNWDVILSDPLKQKLGISYPNDLNQKEKLPTSVMMNSYIVKKLKFMAETSLSHLYIDNCWLDIGKSLRNINYFNEVIIEHEHYSIGKSLVDKTYLKTNSQEEFARSEKIYINFRKRKLPILKIKLFLFNFVFIFKNKVRRKVN